MRSGQKMVRQIEAKTDDLQAICDNIYKITKFAALLQKTLIQKENCDGMQHIGCSPGGQTSAWTSGESPYGAPKV